MPRLLLVGLISWLCVSCGYRWEHPTSDHATSRLAVPYFLGDQDGRLTEAVIQELMTNGYRLDPQAKVALQGEVLEDHLEHIGYQYDKHPLSGEIIHRLIPNEGRREITVRLSMIASDSQEVLYGPFSIASQVDYDFMNADSLQDVSFIDAQGERQSMMFFSLGQLDSEEGAKQSALDPLYGRIAKKIVEGISQLHIP